MGGTRPWGNIQDYSLSVPIRFSPADRANVIVIPSVRSYYEEGADLDDGRTEGLIAAAGWRFSDKLTLGPGFGWFSELGGGSNVFPIILVDSGFWSGLLAWFRNTLITQGTISESDLGLIQIIDDVDEVVEAIFSYYEDRRFEPTEEEAELQLNL